MVWALTGLVILGWWIFAWASPDDMRSLETWLDHGTRGSAPPDLGSDKLFHFLTAFVAVLWLGLGRAIFRPTMRFWIPFAVVVVVACLDELIQGLSPNRTPGVGDVLASILGAAGGILPTRWIQDALWDGRSSTSQKLHQR